MHHRILAAIDGRGTSVRALEAAMQLAHEYGAELQPLCVVDVPIMAYDATGYDPGLVRYVLMEESKQWSKRRSARGSSRSTAMEFTVAGGERVTPFRKRPRHKQTFRIRLQHRIADRVRNTDRHAGSTLIAVPHRTYEREQERVVVQEQGFTLFHFEVHSMHRVRSRSRCLFRAATNCEAQPHNTRRRDFISPAFAGSLSTPACGFGLTLDRSC